MAILDMFKPFTDKLEEVSEMVNLHTILLSDMLHNKKMQTIFNWLLIMWPALLIALDRWLFR